MRREALLLAMVLAPSQARAWGWTQPRGAHYLRTWVRGLVGTRGYLASGAARPLGGTFVDLGLHAYLEYGLTDEWTFIALGRPVGWAQFEGRAAVYTGEYVVGLRRALVRGAWNVAVEVRYGLTPPVGDTPLGAGVIDGAAWRYTPTVESHQFTGELQWGRGLGRVGWITGFVGARYNTAPSLRAVFSAGVQAGARFDFGLLVAASVLTSVPFASFTESDVSGAGNTRFVGWGVDVSYAVTPRWALTAGVGGAFLAEGNAAALPFLLGVEHRAP